jgi:hypothetical protein
MRHSSTQFYIKDTVFLTVLSRDYALLLLSPHAFYLHFIFYVSFGRLETDITDVTVAIFHIPMLFIYILKRHVL